MLNSATNTTIQSVDNSLVHINGLKNGYTPSLISATFYDSSLLNPDTISLTLPPEITSWMIQNQSIIWNNYVLTVVKCNVNSSIIIAANNTTRTLTNVTGILSPRDEVVAIAGSSSVLACMTSFGEIWFTDKLSGNQTEWNLALPPIAKNMIAITAVSEYEFLITGKNYSFLYNIQSNKLRFFEFSSREMFPTSSGSIIAAIGFMPIKYGWGITRIIIDKNRAVQSYNLEPIQVNNYDVVDSQGSGLIHGCRGRNNNLIILHTPTSIISPQHPKPTAKILISSDNGKSYNVRYFTPPDINTNTVQYTLRIFYLTNTDKYYVVVRYANVDVIFSTSDFETWSQEITADKFISRTATYTSGVYYSSYNGSGISKVTRFNGTTHTDVLNITDSTKRLQNVHSSDNGQIIFIQSFRHIGVSTNGGSSWSTLVTETGDYIISSVFNNLNNTLYYISRKNGCSLFSVTTAGVTTELKLPKIYDSSTLTIHRMFIYKSYGYFVTDSMRGLFQFPLNLAGSELVKQVCTPLDMINSSLHISMGYVDNQMDYLPIQCSTIVGNVGTMIGLFKLTLKTLQSELLLNKTIFGWRQTGKINRIMQSNALGLGFTKIDSAGKLAIRTAFVSGTYETNAIPNGQILPDIPITYTNNNDSIFKTPIGLTVHSSIRQFAPSIDTYKTVYSITDTTTTPNTSKIGIVPILGNMLYTTTLWASTKETNRTYVCAGVTINCSVNHKEIIHDNYTGGASWAGVISVSNFGFSTASLGGITGVAHGKNTIVAMTSQGEFSYTKNDIIGTTWKLLPVSPSMVNIRMNYASRNPAITFNNGFFSFVNRQMEYPGGTLQGANNPDPLTMTDLILSYDGNTFANVPSIIDGIGASSLMSLSETFVAVGTFTYYEKSSPYQVSSNFFTWFPTIFKNGNKWNHIPFKPVQVGGISRNPVTNKFVMVNGNYEIFENDLSSNAIGSHWKEVDENILPEPLNWIQYSKVTSKFFGIGRYSGQLYYTTDKELTGWISIPDVIFSLSDNSNRPAIRYITGGRFIVEKLTLGINSYTIVYDIINNTTQRILHTGKVFDEIHFVPSLNKWIIQGSLNAGNTPKLYSSTDLVNFTELTTPITGNLFYVCATTDTIHCGGYYSKDLITWKRWTLNGSDFTPKDLTEIGSVGGNVIIPDRLGQIFKCTESGELINLPINNSHEYAFPLIGRRYPNIRVGYSEYTDKYLLCYNDVVLYTNNGIDYYDAMLPKPVFTSIESLTVEDSQFIVTTSDGTVYISKQFNNVEIPNRTTLPCIEHPIKGRQYYLYTGI